MKYQIKLKLEHKEYILLQSALELLLDNIQLQYHVPEQDPQKYIQDYGLVLGIKNQVANYDRQ